MTDNIIRPRQWVGKKQGQTAETKEKLRVWWIPQVPMQPFYVPVSSVEEGIKIMAVLAEYDLFQYDNNVKPDYANAGGLSLFDPEDDTDGPEGSWVDWFYEDADNWYDDPEEYLRDKAIQG